MDERYLEALEFDKIRARAAEDITCPEARDMLLGQPAWETPDEVRAALEQTDAMTTLLVKNGSPRFSSVENVRGIVRRARRASCGRTTTTRQSRRGCRCTKRPPRSGHTARKPSG